MGILINYTGMLETRNGEYEYYVNGDFIKRSKEKFQYVVLKGSEYHLVNEFQESCEIFFMFSGSHLVQI